MTRANSFEIAQQPLYTFRPHEMEALQTCQPEPFIDAAAHNNDPSTLAAIAGMRVAQIITTNFDNPAEAIAARHSKHDERKASRAVRTLTQNIEANRGEFTAATPYGQLTWPQKKLLAYKPEIWRSEHFDQLQMHSNVSLLGALAGIGFYFGKDNVQARLNYRYAMSRLQKFYS